jgi:hypothetical protein
MRFILFTHFKLIPTNPKKLYQLPSSTWNIIDIPIRTTWTLDEFQQAQKKLVKQIQADLADIWDQIRQELLESCR